MNNSGKIILQKQFFSDSEKIVDLNIKHKAEKKNKVSDLEHLYKALMIGLKNYFKKNNFSSVTLGLSGGVDSALTLSIVADCLDKKKINSFFSSITVHL